MQRKITFRSSIDENIILDEEDDKFDFISSNEYLHNLGNVESLNHVPSMNCMIKKRQLDTLTCVNKRTNMKVIFNESVDASDSSSITDTFDRFSHSNENKENMSTPSNNKRADFTLHDELSTKYDDQVIDASKGKYIPTGYDSIDARKVDSLLLEFPNSRSLT